MVETVIKHLTEFKQMTEAAIPFRLLNEQGEINCARAAEKIHTIPRPILSIRRRRCSAAAARAVRFPASTRSPS